MYRHCIYCSADLKANEAIEGFPVGRTIAFDAAKGRLWAVCGKCGRWNLAPLEERWEPIDQAEKAFRDTRLRVQRENIGVGRLPDGGRLIRIGGALEGELAAWRFGSTLIRRRGRQLLLGTSVAIGLIVIPHVLLGASASIGVAGLYNWWSASRLNRKALLRLSPTDQSDSEAGLVRAGDLATSRLVASGESLAVELVRQRWREETEYDYRAERFRQSPALQPVTLPPEVSRRVLRRGAPVVNAAGASRRQVADAIALLSAAGSAKGFEAGLARGRRRLSRFGTDALTPPEATALEMALNEEDERRALEGELAVLEAAWREAEEIAGIADRLAVAPGGDA